MTFKASFPIPRSPQASEASSRTPMRPDSGPSLRRFKAWLSQQTGRSNALHHSLVHEQDSLSQTRVQQDKAPQTLLHNQGPDTDPPPYHTPSVDTEIATTMTAIATALCTAAGVRPTGNISAATEVASIISILATAIAIVPGDQVSGTASFMSKAIRKEVEIVSARYIDTCRAVRPEDPGDYFDYFFRVHGNQQAMLALPKLSSQTVRKMLPSAWACIKKLMFCASLTSTSQVAVALNTAVIKVADAIAGAPSDSRMAVAVMYASSARRIADQSTRGVVTTEGLEMSARIQGYTIQ